MGLRVAAASMIGPSQGLLPAGLSGSQVQTRHSNGIKAKAAYFVDLKSVLYTLLQV